MKEAIYSSYYCIGLMKLNEDLDFFDSQIQCVHFLMDDEGRNLVEIDHPEKEYATFGDTGELFDLLAATFAVNHDVNRKSSGYFYQVLLRKRMIICYQKAVYFWV